MNTWNVAADDLEFLSRHLEDLEAAGTPGFGLILTERVPFTFDSEKKTLWGEEIGTLEEILDWLESNPRPGQEEFCETISGGYRDSGEQLYSEPCAPVQEDVYVWWNHDDPSVEPAPRIVLLDDGYADEEDLKDPNSEEWDSMSRLVVHPEPLPVTVENILDYIHNEVFTVNVPERIELIPARELLEELTEHFAQQG